MTGRPQRAATKSDRFLRRRVRPRRTSRRALWVALRWTAAATGLGILVAAGFWTAAAAGRAPELAVNRILVEGNERLPEGEILETLGLHPGSNILSLELETLKTKMLSSTWVRDVELARMLPATLTLKVVERVPLGIAVMEELYLIDGDGVVLDEMGPSYGELALPLVRGLVDEHGEVVPDRTRLAGRVLSALASEARLEQAVSEIDLSTGPESIRVFLRRPPMTFIVGESDFMARLTEVLPLGEEIRDRFPAVEAVDLRFQGRVYLRVGLAEPADEDAPDLEALDTAEGR